MPLSCLAVRVRVSVVILVLAPFRLIGAEPAASLPGPIRSAGRLVDPELVKLVSTYPSALKDRLTVSSNVAERLVALSRAKFDLQCKSFGVKEIFEMHDLACDLRTAAARFAEDREAETTGVADLHRQVEEIATLTEKRCQGTPGPLVDLQLARYRAEETAARVAIHRRDRAAEIAARGKAAAAAEVLRQALSRAYEAGAISADEMLNLSQHPRKAKLDLILLTVAQPEQARKARIAVWEEDLALADMLAAQSTELFKAGLANPEDMNRIRAERDGLAVSLAQERGDRQEEIRARERILESRKHCLNVAQHRRATGTISEKAYEDAQARCAIAMADLQEAQAEIKVGQASSNAGDKRGADQFRRVRDLVRMHRLRWEYTEYRRKLEVQKYLYVGGNCDSLTFVEAAARCLHVEFLVTEKEESLRTDKARAPSDGD